MIVLDGVSKSFGQARILDALSLTIPAGQRIALIGSNGAGKTTLFRCLLGEYVHEGTVSLFGHDPRRERTEVLGAIGFVPQIAPRLDMVVQSLIAYVAEISRSSVAAIREVAARMGLDVDTIARRPFVKLSGGMKQKLLIALALGRPTRLLILDEPAANLDPAARAALYQLLAERPDVSMIISSHRIDEIAGLVNRVIELDHGRIILDDTVSDAGRLGSHFTVRIETEGDAPSFTRAAGEWGLTNERRGHWQGRIAGPNRLRLLGFLARHAGLIRNLDITREEGADAS